MDEKAVVAIIVAVVSIIPALISSLVYKLAVANRIESVHKIVNQQRTDMLVKIDKLEKYIKMASSQASNILVSLEEDNMGVILVSTLRVNSLFGYLDGELDGQHINKIIPKRFHKTHNDDLRRFKLAPVNQHMSERKTLLVGLCRDGTEVNLTIELSPIIDNGNLHVLATIYKLPLVITG